MASITELAFKVFAVDEASRVFNEVGKAAAETGEKVEKSGGGFSALGKISGAVMGGMAAAALAFGEKSIEAGDQLENAHAKMETAINNTGSSLDAIAPRMTTLSKYMQNLGFTQTEVDDAMTQGATVTGSATKAMDLMSDAADLARYKHMSLADAANLLAKAQEGNTRAFKQLGIQIPAVITPAQAVSAAYKAVSMNLATSGEQAKFAADHHMKLAQVQDLMKEASKGSAAAVEALGGKIEATNSPTQRMTTALDSLEDKLHGQASTAADTFAGKLAVMKAKFTDVEAEVGQKIVPVLVSMLGWFQKAVDWGDKIVVFLQKHKELWPVVAALIATLVVPAVYTYVAGMVAAAAATLAATWPILAVVAVLTVLGAAALYIAKHWSQIWGEIKQLTADAVGFIKDHLVIIMTVALGPLGFAIAELAKHWRAVVADLKAAASDVAGFFVNNLWHPIDNLFTRQIPGAFRNMTNGAKSAFGGVKDFVVGAFNGMADLVKTPINAIISIINSVIRAIDAVHLHFGGVFGIGAFDIGFNFPQIPQLAAGGLVMPKSGGTLALLAEAGQPEAVIPLNQMSRMLGGQSGGGGSSGDTSHTLVINVIAASGELIEKQLVGLKIRRGGQELAFA